MPFIPCTHLHNDIHIDHGIEEQTQEQPLIEEPKTGSRTRGSKSTRRPHLTSHPRKLTLARKVWISSFVLVWVEELVTIRSEPSHDLAMG
ncbi:hypothetical protein U9M48_000557 [Paspalum notatum var. saurae]|uniref:Uncharacterized protein n=1 Tax=Paspalum notatum var. saurae TaxID=547442 RepID=A0AAQ3PE36_PASNO